MLCSPRKPSSTMRIFSSAEYCFRVARRMSFTTRSDDTLVVSDFCLICASPLSYDEPEILPSSSHPFCPTSANGRQSEADADVERGLGVDVNYAEIDSSFPGPGRKPD